MTFNFCPECGGKCDKQGFKLFVCQKCNRHWFDQPTASAAAFIINGKNELLFGIRKYNPWKGLLGLPGGFIDNDESLEECCKREVQEECGLNLSKLDYFGSYPDVYEYKNYTYKSIVAFFIATSMDLPNINDTKEVDSLVWIGVKNVDLKLVQGAAVNLAVRDFLESEWAKRH